MDDVWTTIALCRREEDALETIQGGHADYRRSVGNRAATDEDDLDHHDGAKMEEEHEDHRKETVEAGLAKALEVKRSMAISEAAEKWQSFQELAPTGVHVSNARFQSMPAAAPQLSQQRQCRPQAPQRFLPSLDPP